MPQWPWWKRIIIIIVIDYKNDDIYHITASTYILLIRRDSYVEHSTMWCHCDVKMYSERLCHQETSKWHHKMDYSMNLNMTSQSGILYESQNDITKWNTPWQKHSVGSLNIVPKFFKSAENIKLLINWIIKVYKVKIVYFF